MTTIKIFLTLFSRRMIMASKYEYTSKLNEVA